MITLQLWINDKLHTEKVYNREPRPGEIKKSAKELYTGNKITIGRNSWFICQVHQSKMNGNISFYAYQAEVKQAA